MFCFTFSTINIWPTPGIDGPNELLQLKLFFFFFLYDQERKQNPVLGAQVFYGDKQDGDSQGNLGFKLLLHRRSVYSTWPLRVNSQSVQLITPSGHPSGGFQGTMFSWSFFPASLAAPSQSPSPFPHFPDQLRLKDSRAQSLFFLFMYTYYLGDLI